MLRLVIGLAMGLPVSALAALALLAVPAGATPLGGTFEGSLTILFEIDGQLDVQLLAPTPRDEGGATVFDFAASFEGPGNSSIDLVGTVDPDPFISWSATFTNFQGDLVPFGWTIILPVQAGPFDRVTNSMSGGLTDISGDGAFLFDVDNDVFLGVEEIVDAGLAATACSAPATGGLSSFDCGSFGSTQVALEPRSPNELVVAVSFQMSEGDLGSLEGLATLSVPEPGTLPLLAGGLAALAVRRRLACAGRPSPSARWRAPEA